jgi:hypothetical protein
MSTSLECIRDKGDNRTQVSVPNELPKRSRRTNKQVGVTVPHRSKSGTVEDKVVFITHRGATHITKALRARKALSAAHVNGKAMNTKTKPEKEPDLGNIKRQIKEAGALSLSRARKPPHIST